jgi:predicted nucleotidyltransferase
MAVSLGFGLSPAVLHSFYAVFAKYRSIERVGIFGSRAAGTFRSGSDIDLAVFGAQMTERDFAKLWNEIDALPLAFKVDLLHWDGLGNQALKESVSTSQRRFWPLP